MDDAAPQAGGDGTWAVTDQEIAEAVDATTAGMLRELFPAWTIGQVSRWVAVRPAIMYELRGPRSLIVPVLIADDAAGLALQLIDQERLRSLAPAELEDVWRGGAAAGDRDG